MKRSLFAIAYGDRFIYDSDDGDSDVVLNPVDLQSVELAYSKEIAERRLKKLISFNEDYYSKFKVVEVYFDIKTKVVD